METLVANCMEIFHKTRQQMCIMVGIYSLVTAILICLGYNVLYFDLTLPNGTSAQLLDLMDYISQQLPDAIYLPADQYSDRLDRRTEMDYRLSG